MSGGTPSWNRSEPSTADVLLRDVAADDLPIFFEHQRDPVATELAAVPPRDWDAFDAHWNKILRDETVITQTVVFLGHVAGNVVSFGWRGQREVGYWIGQEYWGKGIATRALSIFLGRDRNRPLHAHVAKPNIGSIRVLQKCGFTITGEVTVSDERGDGVEEFVLTLE